MLKTYQVKDLSKSIILPLVFLVIFCSFQSYGQSESHSQLMNELNGVYQIEMVNVRYQTAIDTDLLRRIKSSQKNDAQVVFNLSENVRVKILSKEQFNSGDRFADKVLFINE